MVRTSRRSSAIRVRDLVRGPVVDAVLELLDLVVEVVEHREEALGDVVGDHVQDVQRGRVVAERVTCAREVERVAALRRLPDRHDHVRRCDRVHLLQVERVAVPDDHRDNESRDDDVTQVGHRRPDMLAFGFREPCEGRLVQRRRERVAKRRDVRIQQIGPARHRRGG